MSFVIVTSENNVIIIDGGRSKDMPLLKEYVGGRHISAWILTHPRHDHVSGLYGTAIARGRMDVLGVKTHYVTAVGTNAIEIQYLHQLLRSVLSHNAYFSNLYFTFSRVL